MTPIALECITSTSHSTTMTNGSLDAAPRLRKGVKAEYAYPTPLTPESTVEETTSLLQSIDSPFQVQEYIALLVRADPHNVERIVTLPELPSTPSSSATNDGGGESSTITNESGDTNTNSTTAASSSRGGGGGGGGGSTSLVKKDVWIYEQLRRFSQDLSHPFVTSLQEECTREACPEMKAGEWLYLCAAHATANENDCCAIDYIVHTLDGATALLNSARYFPSRISVPHTSLKHFTSIARRLYRIFAHAWYHHREVFEQCEAETSLYARFLALVDHFELIAPDLLVIPRDGILPVDDST